MSGGERGLACAYINCWADLSVFSPVKASTRVEMAMFWVTGR